MATMDAKPKALTSTERSQKFRERLKRDRLRSEGARKKDRERKRKARKKQKEEMSEAEKEIARMKKRDEMRKYRQKKKQIDELRLYWKREEKSLRGRRPGTVGQSSIRLTSMYRQLQSIDDCNFAISMR